MQVLINGEVLNKAVKGITINEKLSDDIDFATVIYTSNEAKGFEPYLKAIISYETMSKTFITYDDYSELTDSSKGIYTHTLQLVEMTKYLEKITIPAQSYTMNDPNLYTQIYKLCENAEVRRSAVETRFWFTSSFHALVSSVGSYDFKFDNTTLRDALDEMLSILNVRCVVEDLVYEDGEIVQIGVGYKDLKPSNEIIDTIPRKANEKYYTNADYLTESFDIYGENASFETSRTIWYPSMSGWATLKTNEATLTTKNAIIDVKYPIEEITQFVILADVGIDRGDGSDPLIFTGMPLALTEEIVDSEVFAALDENEKKNYIYYVRGSKEINNNKYKELFFSFDSLYNAATRAAVRFAREEYGSQAFGRIEGGITSDLTKLLYRVEYKPYTNIFAKPSKLKYNKLLKGLSQYDNQQTRNVDIFRYGINAKNKINQAGLIKREVYADTKNIEDLLELGVNYQGNILVAREYQLYPKHVNIKYQFAESFTAVNERLAIRREKRIYNIPLETFDRNVLFKSYVLMSETEKLNKGFVNKRFLGIFTNSFVKNTTSVNRVSNIITTTSATANNYALSCNNYAFGNALCFTFAFEDNYSAGKSVGNSVVGGKKMVQNPYVNSSGAFSSIDLTLSTLTPTLTTRTKLEQIARALPKINLSDLAVGHELSENVRYSLYKDRLETIIGTIQVDIRPTIANEEKIIIGTHFLFKNLLIDSYKVEDIFIYASTETYNVSENVAVKGVLVGNATINNKDQNNEPSNFIEVAGLPQTNTYNSWAIADGKGNLILACNDYSLSKIYFYSSWEIE